MGPLVEITSAANPRIRAAAALRDRRERDERGLTLVDGIREVDRALASGIDVVDVFVSDALERRADGARLLAALAARGITPTVASGPALSKLAFGDRLEGIVAVVRTPPTTLDRLRPSEAPLLVVLEGVEKPGNIGAVLRSADGAGADALIAAEAQTDLYNPNAIRASLGTIFTVPVAAGSSAAVRAWLDAGGIRPIAARVDAERRYSEADLTGPVALVLGAEATGLSSAWDGPGVEPVRIPMQGVADSLNVSVAAAVLLFEARRQRDTT